MRNLKTKILFIFLSIFLASCFVPLSVGYKYKELINREVVFKKQMVVGFLKEKTMHQYHLIDPAVNYWSDYEIVKKFKKGDKVKLTNVGYIILGYGGNYWFEGNTLSEGKRIVFHYILPIDTKPSKSVVKEVWEYDEE